MAHTVGDSEPVVAEDDQGKAEGRELEEPDWCGRKRQPVDTGRVNFTELLPTVKTGDLVELYHHGNPHPYYGILVCFANSDLDVPPLLIKGRTRSLKKETFTSHKVRHLHINVAAVSLFYGDYEKVAIRRLKAEVMTPHEKDVLDVEKKMDQMPFSPDEMRAIEGADSPEQRSAVLCALNLARVFHELGILETNDPSSVRPDTLVGFLPLQEPDYLELPPVKLGPAGDPPLLAKLALVYVSPPPPPPPPSPLLLLLTPSPSMFVL